MQNPSDSIVCQVRCSKLHFRFESFTRVHFNKCPNLQLATLKSGWNMQEDIEKKKHPESHPKRSKQKAFQIWHSWDHQMPLALNQARLSLPSSAKHVNHVTRTTTLLQIPLFEAKPSQAASISNCPYVCAVITILYRVLMQHHEMCRYFTTPYNFIELSFYAFNNGDAKIPSSSFHNFKSSWFWGMT